MTLAEIQSDKLCITRAVLYVAPLRGACLAEPLHTLSSTVPRIRSVADPAAADLSRRLRSVQRAMLLHVSGNSIVSGTAWWGGDQIAASDFARFLRAAHPQLTSCPPEFEAVQ